MDDNAHIENKLIKFWRSLFKCFYYNSKKQPYKDCKNCGAPEERKLND